MRIKGYRGLPVEAKEIRETVFLKEQGFEREADSKDEYAMHFVAYEGEMAVGTCRVTWNDDVGTYAIGRLAVLKDYRGRGIGAKLVEKSEEYAKIQQETELQLHAQCTAMDFYRKLGYTEYGEVEYEQDCPHMWMRKDLL